jgi:hypothetical protein
MRRKHPSSNVCIRRIPFQGIHSSTIIIKGYTETAPLEFEVGGNAALVDPLVGVVDEAIFGVTKCHVGDTRLFVWNTNSCVPTSKII